MLRQAALGTTNRRDHGFRWRGREVSRVEALSDAVFAFSVTLLVVSLEVPKTFHELQEAMNGFFGFALSFASLLLIWHSQYTFFRRYALEDGITFVLNAVLLFVVLYFVYPLKFLYSLLAGQILGQPSTVMVDGQLVPIIQGREWMSLIMIYSMGFAAIYLVFTLLYLRAYRKREELELTDVEIVLTRGTIRENAAMVVIGLVSVTLARLGMPTYGGLIYMLIGPAMTWLGFRTRNERRRIDPTLVSA